MLKSAGECCAKPHPNGQGKRGHNEGSNRDLNGHLRVSAKMLCKHGGGDTAGGERLECDKLF